MVLSDARVLYRLCLAARHGRFNRAVVGDCLFKATDIKLRDPVRNRVRQVYLERLHGG